MPSVAFNIEIGVQPPSARRKFTYATLASKQLNRIISSSEESFTAEHLYTNENNQRLMLWYDEFTVYLHQLLTPKNIDPKIAGRLKQAAPTVPTPSVPVHQDLPEH